MNFMKNKRSHAPAVQMASLMDIVFLLLCFFVTSSVFSQWETEVAITLPTAKSATIPPGACRARSSSTSTRTARCR